MSRTKQKPIFGPYCPSKPRSRSKEKISGRPLISCFELCPPYCNRRLRFPRRCFHQNLSRLHQNHCVHCALHPNSHPGRQIGKPNRTSNPENRRFFLRKPKIKCHTKEKPQINAEIEIWLSLKTDFFQSQNRKSDREKSPKPQNLKIPPSKKQELQGIYVAFCRKKKNTYR